MREEQQARASPAPVTGADGITRTRLETERGRALAALFGTVTITRCALRKPGAPNWHPADAALSLPSGRHSRTLAKLAVIEAARGSFDDAREAITRRCGPVIGKRQIEESVVHAAAGIPAFYAARVPQPCTSSTLLVMSAGGKGIVMRPGALRAAKAAAKLGKMRTRLAAGEKPNRKRTACLATVYDTEPAQRRPHGVIAPPGGRHGDRKLPPGPKALARWLAGSVRNDPAEVIAAMYDEAEARDPAHLRTWVVLVDGAEHQMDLVRAGAAMLAGDSARAAQEITTEADAAELAGSRRTGTDACVRYPGEQARLPPLRPGPRGRLAERDRGHRGRVPAPSRSPLDQRVKTGPGRCRGCSHPPRGHHQRGLQRGR
jgi:hypothetical protein